jgi:hypothetical protein
MMHQTLAYIAISTGIFIAVLKLLDFLLTELQKARLKRKVENLWVWLASRDFKKYFSFFMGKKFHLVSVIMAYIYYVLPFIILPMLDSEFELLQGVSGSSWAIVNEEVPKLVVRVLKVFDIIFLGVTAFLIYRFVMPWVYGFLTKKASYIQYYLRLVIINLGIFVALSILSGILIMLSLALAMESDINSAWFIGVLTVYSIVVIPLGLLANIYPMILLLSMVWMGLITPLLMMSIRSLQFVVFRVSENKNGIIMGLSGFFIGVGLLVNVLVKFF